MARVVTRRLGRPNVESCGSNYPRRSRREMRDSRQNQSFHENFNSVEPTAAAALIKRLRVVQSRLTTTKTTQTTKSSDSSCRLVN